MDYLISGVTRNFELRRYMIEDNISRREFLKLTAIAAASLIIPDKISSEISQKKDQEDIRENPFPFINQRNNSQCAVASMAMLIACHLQRKGKKEDVNKIYDQVLLLVGRQVPTKGSGIFGNELITILERGSSQFDYKLITKNSRPYDPRKMAVLLNQNGPAIVDVDVNYETAENANHWVVVVKTEGPDNNPVINIADPFRSKEKLPYLSFPSKKPKDMVFKPDGTITIPWETFSKSAGNVFIQLEQRTNPSTSPYCASKTKQI